MLGNGIYQYFFQRRDLQPRNPSLPPSLSGKARLNRFHPRHVAIHGHRKRTKADESGPDSRVARVFELFSPSLLPTRVTPHCLLGPGTWGGGEKEVPREQANRAGRSWDVFFSRRQVAKEGGGILSRQPPRNIRDISTNPTANIFARAKRFRNTQRGHTNSR